MFVKVQVQFSPSFMSISTPISLPPLVIAVAPPPFPLVAVQLAAVPAASVHPEGMVVSVMSYFWKTSMSLNALVPPQPTLKPLRGEGVAVKPNDANVSLHDLLIVIEPLKMTASAESERSWFPPEPSRAIRRVWYGEPGMATHELVAPQSSRVEMCPPHAITGLAWLAVKVIVMRLELSPVGKFVPPE